MIDDTQPSLTSTSFQSKGRQKSKETAINPIMVQYSCCKTKQHRLEGKKKFNFVFAGLNQTAYHTHKIYYFSKYRSVKVELSNVFSIYCKLVKRNKN